MGYETATTPNGAAHENKLMFNNQVIKKIIGLAPNEIEGILSMSGWFMSGLTKLLRSTEDNTKGISTAAVALQVAFDLKVIVTRMQSAKLMKQCKI
ncbi:Asp23/Gls24 family envelope stress response protein [Paenibacillus donghaensis]|uniref:Uncharacterized protein n=1 Tax=Paenibacillus donghaensis TaxID=414771 RepID=A0A2Z2KUJ7_9BACL|nr:Asp23/Gls24 family envelope stress response protein [Paenibacillus donghaensis]ASA23438.1 hypothetical protein B9T62_23095 [Paenibacillus donghaensis]